MVVSAALCNNASFDETETLKNVPIRQRKANGDATDIAVLKFCSEYRENTAEIVDNYAVLAEIPFNSKNKWMMKIVRPKDLDVHQKYFTPNKGEEQDLVLLKGAPDYLLKKATHLMDLDGNLNKLTEERMREIVAIQKEWSMSGLRVLIICKKQCDFLNISNSTAELENYIKRSNDFCVVGRSGLNYHFRRKFELCYINFSKSKLKMSKASKARI